MFVHAYGPEAMNQGAACGLKPEPRSHATASVSTTSTLYITPYYSLHQRYVGPENYCMKDPLICSIQTPKILELPWEIHFDTRSIVLATENILKC